ncbi:LOW QUALITY PROTEIN: hypothetical protein TorRG33x02_212800 [Trema orientale]|uniref:Uncharacterized protein n=1 Tax=Trema orientale TaxID=63057 RepID=A0A2P5EBG5_TREOI|nr:LOW QUALITY PROTEIN: hypothetical protein TorRG33x02_212800 [Trema orientale]
MKWLMRYASLLYLGQVIGSSNASVQKKSFIFAAEIILHMVITVSKPSLGPEMIQRPLPQICQINGLIISFHYSWTLTQPSTIIFFIWSIKSCICSLECKGDGKTIEQSKLPSRIVSKIAIDGPTP